MRNFREADVVLNRAIARLGRLHLSSTAEINDVATLQAELKSARAALERTKQRLEVIEHGTPSAAMPRSPRYAAVFEHALDAILVADDSARYIDVNDSACCLLGYSRDQLLRMGVADVTPVAQRHLVPRLWAEFLEQGSMSGEYVVQASSGQGVHVDFRAVANVVPGEHVSIMRDVTKLRTLQQSRQADASALRENVTTQLYRALDVLVAVKIGFASSPWRLMVPRNSRSVTTEIDAAIAGIREAATSLAVRATASATPRKADPQK